MHEYTKRLLDAARDARSHVTVKEFSDLQAELDVSPATMTNWKTRGVSKDGALKAERVVGCLAQWVLDGVGGAFPSADVAHPDRPPVVGGAPTIQILDEFTVPPLITWVELMRTVALADLVRITAPDDALPDDAPRGAELIMSTVNMAPRRGDIVLVRDSHGALYLRRYAEGRGGTWRAVTGRGDGVYLDLDSAADGLVLVAVAEWVKPRRG